MKNLPIGIQSFSKIRDKKKNYYYVDKTKFAYDLITNYHVTLLTRPRRFGKSLFVDTLKELFEGNKELFEGLFIYDKWNGMKNILSFILVSSLQNLIKIAL